MARRIPQANTADRRAKTKAKAKSPAPAAGGRQLVEQLAAALDEVLEAGASADAEAKLAQSEARAAELEAKLAEVSGERDDLSSKVDGLELQLAEVEARADDLEKENRQLNHSLSAHRLAGGEASGERRAESAAEVASVAGAVELADRRFGSLAFLREARVSAEDSNYQQPAKVFQAFEALDELARRRADGTLNRSIGDWLKERGFNYTAHESKTTMGKWGGQRTFRHNGAKITMEEHIKFGIGPDPANHLRIHLTWDDAESRWLIGHVGRHLTNTKT